MRNQLKMPKFKRYFEVDKEKHTTGKQKYDHTREKRGVLSEDVMSYYRQVSSTLETGFDEDAPDVKAQFLTNVFSVLKDEGVNVSRNQTVSRILEVLFTYSSPSHLRPLLCQFCKELTIVVFDAFASHVFQALIQYLPLMFVENKEDGDTEDVMKQLKESTLVLCAFMESHLRDVMTHVYGSHVLRSVLEVLGGVVVKQEIVRSRVSRNQRVNELARGPESNSSASKSFSEEYKTWFETLSQKIVRLCNYEDHLSDPHYCPVLQTVLLILHKTSPSQYEELAATILEKTCSSTKAEDIPADDVVNRLPQVVQNEIGSYLVELLISLTTGPKFEELYNWLFKGKLLHFAVHPFANYVLQKLLSCISDKKMMQNVLDDISVYIEDILAVNHCGIVTKLAEACQRTGVGQEQFLQLLMSAFHCHEPASRHNKIVPLVASFQTYEVFHKTSEDQKEEAQALLKSVIIHGSLILQQLLRFSKPVAVVDSLLGLSPAELLFLCCDKFGSHIVDVFFQSLTVRDKHKDAFVKKLIGLYINMACNRNGSRCLENMWKFISMQERILIAEDLCKTQERLEGDQVGRFIYRNFALYKFVNRRKEWRDIQGANSKKQQLLKGILEGKQDKKKKKQKVAPTYHAIGENEQKQSEQFDRTEQEQKENQAESPVNSSLGVVERKTKKRKKVTPESSSADVPVGGANFSPNNVDGGKKKRKRNKEKKRIARATSEPSVDTENVHQKKRKHEESTEAEEEFAVLKKRQKYVKNGITTPHRKVTIVADGEAELPKKKKKKDRQTETLVAHVKHKDKVIARGTLDKQEFLSPQKNKQKLANVEEDHLAKKKKKKRKQ